MSSIPIGPLDGSFLEASKSFKGCNYENQVKIADGVYLEFLDAGHILGSASVLLDFDGYKKVSKEFIDSNINNYRTDIIQSRKSNIILTIKDIITDSSFDLIPYKFQ